MSPPKSIKHDVIAPGELGLLQKLEEVGTSIKVSYVLTFHFFPFKFNFVGIILICLNWLFCMLVPSESSKTDRGTAISSITCRLR